MEPIMHKALGSISSGFVSVSFYGDLHFILNYPQVK